MNQDCHCNWHARYVVHCCGNTGVTEMCPSWTDATTCARSAIQPRIQTSNMCKGDEVRGPGCHPWLVQVGSASNRGGLANGRQSARSDLLARWVGRHGKVDDCPNGC